MAKNTHKKTRTNLELFHDRKEPKIQKRPQKIQDTGVCKIVHKFASAWCKTALEEVAACHSHDDVPPLSFWLQVTEAFF